MTDLVFDSNESHPSSTLTTNTSSTSCNNVSRRRLAFRPQSIKIASSKPIRPIPTQVFSSNECVENSTINSLEAYGFSTSKNAIEDGSLSRISSSSNSNPSAEVFQNCNSQKATASTSAVLHSNNTKVRRRSVSNWTFQETLSFYEGLKQHGKDFEAIARHMAKKKFNKDKDQIRNYYFNAFKIWKLKAQIEESDWSGVPRDARELFVVLNGCEWRKKTAGANFDAFRFKTLILDGVTSARVKKKLVTIRTPYCSCLLKFFPYDKRNAQIPTHLSLKLVPYRYIDRNYVLFCEQNPLLQLRMNINDKISNIFGLLERKWISPLNRLTFEKDNVGDSFFSNGDTAIRLRVNDNIQIHKVQVNVNNIPALSMRKLKRDYAPDYCLDDDNDSNANSTTVGTKVELESTSRTNFGALLSADESSNEPSTKIHSNKQSSGKPSRDCNVIKIDQTAAKNVFDIDEVKLRAGLTRENAANASVLQLFYLCGMVDEIMLSYELINPLPNLDLSWRTFISLVRRDYGELTTKAIQRSSEQQNQQAITSAAVVGNSNSNMAFKTTFAPSTTSTISNASTFIDRSSINLASSNDGSLDRLLTQIRLKSKAATPIPVDVPATSMSCSIGDLLGITRRRSKRKNFVTQTANAAPDSSTLLKTILPHAGISIVTSENLSSSTICSTQTTAAMETNTSTTNTTTLNKTGISNNQSTEPISSPIVDAENAQFLKQLHYINSQPTKKIVKRQVKVVPNNSKLLQTTTLSSTRTNTGGVLNIQPEIYEPFSSQSIRVCDVRNNSIDNMAQLNDANIAVLNTPSEPVGNTTVVNSSDVLQTSNNTSTVTYLVSPFVNAFPSTKSPAYLSCSTESVPTIQQPLVLDQIQLSSLLYQNLNNKCANSSVSEHQQATLVAYLPQSGQLVNLADVNTAVNSSNNMGTSFATPLLSATIADQQNSQLQYSNLTESTADTSREMNGVANDGYHLTTLTSIRPTDFSQMTTSTNQTNINMANLAMTSKITPILEAPPLSTHSMSPSSTVTIFRSPTKSALHSNRRQQKRPLRNYDKLHNCVTWQKHAHTVNDAGTTASITIESDAITVASTKNYDQNIANCDYEETNTNASLGPDFSMDSSSLSAFGGNSNLAVKRATSSLVILDASPSSKTLPEDVHHAYELMLKENSVDYCRNFEQLTRNMDLYHSYSNSGCGGSSSNNTLHSDQQQLGSCNKTATDVRQTSSAIMGGKKISRKLAGRKD